jgi:hypothetical protein
MPLTDAVLNTLGSTLDGLITHASLHTADPGTTGANESSAARQAVSFTVDADGDLTLDSTLAFTGGAASGACTHVGLWSASSGGTFRGGFALTGDQTFNAAGEYNVTALTINGTSS